MGHTDLLLADIEAARRRFNRAHRFVSEPSDVALLRELRAVECALAGRREPPSERLAAVVSIWSDRTDLDITRRRLLAAAHSLLRGIASAAREVA